MPPAMFGEPVSVRECQRLTRESRLHPPPGAADGAPAPPAAQNLQGACVTPTSGRSELRVLFAFDPARRAILLLAGDKAGNWSNWYRAHIPLADELFDVHLAQVKKAQAEKKREK
ncbi:type II toxin-antitoxin system RelE/ParE family toxin [Microbacterium sp. SLBN-111]|uniref:type II toxin-antitoxin system RelE/ParE family toxin n=1 Tax=Microbacterium sp. SLBN-111 TaxID=3377733 RepID=UPI003C77EA77